MIEGAGGVSLSASPVRVKAGAGGDATGATGRDSHGGGVTQDPVDVQSEEGGGVGAAVEESDQPKPHRTVDDLRRRGERRTLL